MIIHSIAKMFDTKIIATKPAMLGKEYTWFMVNDMTAKMREITNAASHALVMFLHGS